MGGNTKLPGIAAADVRKCVYGVFKRGNEFFPGAVLGNMFQFQSDFEEYFWACADPVLLRSMNPELQTFDQWLTRNAAKMPIDS